MLLLLGILVLIVLIIAHFFLLYLWIGDVFSDDYIKKKKEAIMFCIPIFGVFYFLYLVVKYKMKDLGD